MGKSAAFLFASIAIALLTSACSDTIGTGHSEEGESHFFSSLPIDPPAQPNGMKVWYKDADGDGYSDGTTQISTGRPKGGYFLAHKLLGLEGDCDDANEAVHPGVEEICNDLDDDCDGAIDEDMLRTFYADADSDGFGNPDASTQSCIPLDGYGTNAYDCDDYDAAIHPGAPELCDGLDNDCDGALDEGVIATFYADADGDGCGDSAVPIQACLPPAGYVADATDCDDHVEAIHPGAPECCDGLDNDCDGVSDEEVTATFYADVDGDGYGDAAVSVQACAAPAAFTSDSTDCDDTVAATHPGAAEICGNGFDENCSGTADDDCAQVGAIQVATKIRSSLALKGDGTVWGWGRNYFGELGDGTRETRPSAVQVVGISGAISLASGDRHSLALKDDGTVWGWGDDSQGQLGDGAEWNWAEHPDTTRYSPVQAAGLSGVVAVASGNDFSLALKEDGTVWAWGYGGYLGDGTYTRRTTPVQVINLTGVVSVAGGQHHTLALKGDGTVWAWGYNGSGRLGDGTTVVQLNAPAKVVGLMGVRALAAGNGHSLALKNDGTVWAWGLNSVGQLGDGTTQDKITPILVPGLADVTAIAAGEGHSLALKRDGSVWAWGWNYTGQLGDGSTLDRRTPVQVNGLSGAIGIAGGYNHSLAYKDDGSVWGWGSNDVGELGDGTMMGSSYPVQVVFP